MGSTRGAALSRASALRVTATAIALSVPVGCQLIAQLEEPVDHRLDASPSVSEAASDGGSDGDAADLLPRECRPVFDTPPPQSAATDVPPFVLALSSIAFLPSEVDAGDLCPVGALALDDKQTGLDDPPSGTCLDDLDASCAPSCRNPNVKKVTDIADYAGGADNGFLRLRTALLAGRDVGNAADALIPNPALRAGKNNLLLKVSGYNGQPDDDNVSVGVFESSGVESDAGVSWDGVSTLTWQVVDPNKPDNLEQGFVRDGVLMLEIRQPFVMPFFSERVSPEKRSFRAHVPYARLTGRLVPVPQGGYAISSGIMGYVLSTKELINLVWHVPAALFIPEAAADMLACASPTFDPAFFLCQYADMASDAGTACDRISVGIAFRAGPARMGTLVRPTTEVDRCVGAGPNYDANADCDYLVGGADQ